MAGKGTGTGTTEPGRTGTGTTGPGRTGTGTEPGTTSRNRFSEVANIQGSCSLNIHGKIASQMLSKRTTYAVYLLYKLAPSSYSGLVISNSVVRFVNRETEEPRRVGRISWPNAQRRVDRWMEIEMGKFFNDAGENGDVEARLMEIRCHFGIDNLFVEGIEFRAE
ncbi:hypothetical protein MTR67_047385 [Solanum verrucosum]|uniref:Uncharacterized protein n=1 Tax=Solanum verrucosum TaxID=315347 RepID=A0AAF0UXR8_SOLVR|nr:F-box protein PP2-B10-like [Solanum verrucosum]WMV54000.1 hypothetical protein MTR67_047385 [Solanum verrucosum]